MRIGEESLQLRQGEVGLEFVQRIAEFFPGFSHHRRACNETERIEGHLGAIAVRIDKELGREHAVVEFGTCRVPHGVCRLGRRQIVPVIVTTLVDIAEASR